MVRVRNIARDWNVSEDRFSSWIVAILPHDAPNAADAGAVAILNRLIIIKPS